MTATQKTPAQTLNDICMDVMKGKPAGQTIGMTTAAAEKISADASKLATERAAKRQGAKPKAEPKEKRGQKGSAAFAALTKTVASTMVTCGGTNAEPEKTDAAKFPAVTMAELQTTGSALQNLAFNFLAGTVDASITGETLKNLPRALRNEKTAINGLLGKKSADIRAAWEKEQSTRKRLDTPTLRALWAAAKGKTAKKGGETWKDKVAKILDGKQSDKLKLQMLRELVDETK